MQPLEAPQVFKIGKHHKLKGKKEKVVTTLTSGQKMKQTDLLVELSLPLL
jgi:hypothetical protein